MKNAKKLKFRKFFFAGIFLIFANLIGAAAILAEIISEIKNFIFQKNLVQKNFDKKIN